MKKVLMVLFFMLITPLFLNAGSRQMAFEERYHIPVTPSPVGGVLIRLEFNRQTIAPTSPMDVPDTNVVDSAFASSGINYWDARVFNSDTVFNPPQTDPIWYYDGTNYWTDGTNIWSGAAWIDGYVLGLQSGQPHVYYPTVSPNQDCLKLRRTVDGAQTQVGILFGSSWSQGGVWNDGSHNGDPRWLLDDGFLKNGTQTYTITNLTAGANAKLVFYNICNEFSGGDDRSYTVTANGVGPVTVVSKQGNGTTNGWGGGLVTGITVDPNGCIIGTITGIGNTGGEIFLTGMQIWTDQ